MTRSKLKAIVTGRSGAFDLPSIIVAVVTVVLLTAGVLATIFGIIPFAQDNGTRQDIAAVRTAEGAALVKDGKFTDIPGLISAGYLSEKAASALEDPASGDGPFVRVDSTGKIKTAAGVNAKGDCYIALGKSGTGKIFWGSDKTSDPQELKPTDDTGCLTPDQLKALVASLGGFEGKYSPLDPAVTGAAQDSLHAAFTWNAVDTATGYRVESRIDGRAWTVINDNQTETTVTVTANPSDVIDVRVTARNAGGDSGYGNATVKLADPIIANGGFENGLTSWNPSATGATAVSDTVHGGSGAAKLTANASTSMLSQSVEVPAESFSTLTFWSRASNVMGTGARLEIVSSAGAVLATPFTFTGNDAGWVQRTVDMTDFRGQTVTLRFVESSTYTGYTGTALYDDLLLTSTPPVITDAPTRVGATADDTSASITWSAPSSRATNITSYIVTPYKDGAAQAPVTVTGNPATAAATLTGLTNGASYTFTVKATNSAGTSAPSAASAAVVPGPAPISNAGFEAGLKSWTTTGTVQTSTTTHTGFGSASLTANASTSTMSQSVNVPAESFSTLTFWARASNVMGTSTRLEIVSPAGAVLATPFTFTGNDTGWVQRTVDMTDYKGQTVTLRFVEYSYYGGYVGTALYDDLVLTSTPPVITDAPTRVGATADNTTASVAWDAPSSRATNITAYTITPYLNGAAQAQTTVTGSPAPTAATITGLTNGGSYTFTVTATNAAGTSPESIPSAAVTTVDLIIQNAGFEADLQSWTVTGNAQPSATARTGFGAAKLTAHSQTSTITQSVNVPADMFSSLDFWYTADNYANGGSPSYTRTELQVRDSSGTVLATPFTTAADVPAWTKATVDLTDFKGQTVTLALVQFDYGYGTSSTSSFDDLVFTSTPPVITDAPTRVGATADDTTASLTWVAPSSRATNITAYTITPYLNGAAQTQTTVTGSPAPTAATITGLTNGGSYTFTVKATNSAGTSAPSAASAAVAPGPVKIANAGFEAGLKSWTVTGNAQPSATARTGFGAAKLTAHSQTSTITQSVNVPADMFSSLDFWYTSDNYSNGGNPSYTRTELQVRDSSGTVLATPFTTAADVPAWTKATVDLTDFKGQTVTLALVQFDYGYGTSSTSSFDDLVFTSTPPVITDAPTRVGATADDTTASITWVAPSSRATNITAYTVTPYKDGAAQAPVTVTGNWAPTAATITGLTNGASYTFTVKATNSAGTSAPSAASAMVVPGPVKIANAGFEAGLRSWTVAGTAQPSATARTGFGAAKLTAHSQTSAITQSVNVPADMFSSLDFWYTADNYSNGGYPSYTRTELQVRDSSGTVLATPFTTAADVPAWTKATVDLTDFKGQTVTLALAQFDTGYGTSSTSSFDDLIFTSTPPVITPAPTRVGATADDTTASLTWVAPSSRATNITAYTVTPYKDGAAQTPVTVTGSPAPAAATLTGLTNGASYTFTVKATNSAGTSPESTPSAAVVPGPVKIANAGFEAGLKSWTSSGATAPSTAARTGFGSAQLNSATTNSESYISQSINVPAEMSSSLDLWVATSNNVGQNVTQIQIRSTTGTLLDTPFSSTANYGTWLPVSVDMTKYKGTTVVLRLNQKNNNAGNYPGSANFDDLVFTSTPPVTSTPPTRVGVTADDTTASLAWVAPASPATNITAYTITPYLNGAAQSPVTVTGNPAPAAATLTGLTNGASYTFTVNATNSAGTSPESPASAPVVPGPVKIANAGFEAGLKSWTRAGTAGPSATTRTGFGSATLASTNAVQDSSISQSVNVPANMVSGLDFWYLVTNTHPVYNKTELQIMSTSGTVLATPFTNSGDNAAWKNASVDLTAYQGQTIVLKFNQHNNGYSTSGTSTIDDLTFTSTPTVAPAAPTNVTASGGNTVAYVTWTAPASPGSTITAYAVTPFLGGVAQTPATVSGNPAATSAVVPGLTNGTAYTFTVSATNALGTSPDSAASAAATPTPTVVRNGGFESDLAQWTAGGAPAPTVSTTAHSGSKSVMLGNANGAQSNIAQTVVVPNTAAPSLTYWFKAASAEGGCSFDYLKVEARTASGTAGTLLKTTSLCTSTGTAWNSVTVPLTAYKGQAITLWFNVSTDGSNVSSALLDDVSITE